MSYKVFISYSTKDLDKVNHIRSLFQKSSVEVYVAEYSLQPGSPLSESIIQAIKSCDLFMLLWSSSSKESEWVPQEIGIARSSNKPILPLVLEPNLKLPGFISNLKYLNVYKNPEMAQAWLVENLYRKAQEKQKQEGLFWLGLGAVVTWLASN